jgi:hypothetical protein
MLHDKESIMYPVGVSDYRELVTGGYGYVDKSLSILEVLRDGVVSIICRPRRFGKTLFMSMLQHFFAENVRSENTRALFKSSLLAQKNPEILKEHQGQYSVIYLTCKDLRYPSFEGAYQGFQGLLSRLYVEHSSLLDSLKLDEAEKEAFEKILKSTANDAGMRTALRDLSAYLYKAYGKRVIILIDEYDTPILSGYMEGDYKQIIDFMRGFLGAALKDNPCVFKSVITGIIRVAKENLFSDLNNALVHTVLLDRYSDAFGFTESEVNCLLEEAELSSSAAQIKRWYNGYQIGPSTIYNPWSIIRCLSEKGLLKLYWVNTSGNDLIRKILSEAGPSLKIRLEKLIQGESIPAVIDEHVTFENLSNNETALWSLLLFSGYLTAMDAQLDDEGFYQAQLRIPNQELLHLYRRQVVGWFRDYLGYTGYKDFINHLLTGNLDRFQQDLNHYLKSSMSYFDSQGKEPERFYHGLVLGLIATLHDRYQIFSNRESGYGRYDIAMIPADKSQMGLVIEFKSIADEKNLIQGAEMALTQIKTKLYSAELTQAGVRKILQVGMAFSGKQVAIAHEIIQD